VVPSCSLDFDGERSLGCVAPDDIEGAPSEDCDGGGAVILAVAGCVLAKGDIELPMKGVLDGPVGADCIEQHVRRWHP